MGTGDVFIGGASAVHYLFSMNAIIIRALAEIAEAVGLPNVRQYGKNCVEFHDGFGTGVVIFHDAAGLRSTFTVGENAHPSVTPWIARKAAKMEAVAVAMESALPNA